MSIEVGSKIQGKVTGITHFGAFVELPGGSTGLVHISEVADNYVKDINEFLKVGDEVLVKVVNVEQDGKIGLSIRKAEDRLKVQNVRALQAVLRDLRQNVLSDQVGLTTRNDLVVLKVAEAVVDQDQVKHGLLYLLKIR